MNLCIDIDGTITKPNDWLKRANAYFGKNVAPEDVTVYEVHKVLGIERQEFEAFYQRYGKLIHWEAEIRKGVREFLDRMALDHQIHIVTAREERMRDITEKWLGAHGIPMDSLALLGNPNKVWKARQLESDLFIEDSYSNAIQLAEAGFEVLLLNCTYNQGILPGNVSRVSGWHEIYQIVKKREKLTA